MHVQSSTVHGVTVTHPLAKKDSWPPAINCNDSLEIHLFSSTKHSTVLVKGVILSKLRCAVWYMVLMRLGEYLGDGFVIWTPTR